MQELFNIYARCNNCNKPLGKSKDIPFNKMRKAYREYTDKNHDNCPKHPNGTITYRITVKGTGMLGPSYPLQFFDEPDIGKNISTETL